MKKYIFVTPEGLTFKPSYDSPEPDYLDLQIFGFGQSNTVQDAIEDLIELQENDGKGNSQQPFTLRVENNCRKNFWVKEKRDKTSMAS